MKSGRVRVRQCVHSCTAAWGHKHTGVVVYELDLGQGEGVVEGHEDSWLHHNVNHVHGCMPKEESGCVKPCKHTYKVRLHAQSGGKQDVGAHCMQPLLCKPCKRACRQGDVTVRDWQQVL